MRRIRLNHSTCPEAVSLDPQELINSKALISGNSGSGKSFLMRVIAEQLGNRIPMLILDPEGEWSTLRTHVHAVLAGPGGDVQADPRLAKKLARKLLEADCSAVLDLSELKSLEKRAFVRLFLEGLLSAPRRLWGARAVFIDEAHKFAPESGREAESRQAVIDLMDSGRKRGLGGIIATQRLSKLAADARAEANNVMLGRFAQDLDLRRASDLLGFQGRSKWDGIRQLPPGRFMGMGPAFNFPGVQSFQTTDELKTEHPKAGSRHLVAPPKPSKRIRSVLAKLGDLPKEAKEESDELESLRRRVRELSKGGRRSKVDVEAAVVRACGQLATAHQRHIDKLTKAHAKELQSVGAEWGRKWAETTRLLAKVKTIVDDHLGKLEVDMADTKARWTESVHEVPQAPVAKAKRSRAKTASSPNGLPTSGAPYKLLVGLLQQGKPTSRARAALLAQMSRKSSTFRNAMSTLRNSTPPLMADVGDGMIAATDAAHELYDAHYEPMPEGDELIAVWRDRLGGADQRLFDVLVNAGGEPLERDDAAEASETTAKSSTFRNAMSKLRRLGLMRDAEGKTIALGEELL